MSEDWKNKDIQPYLKGKPANWSDTDSDWVAFKGNEKLEQELASIKKKQSEILERLEKPIDTQVTGRNVEYPSDYPDSKANERLEASEQTQESIISALQTTNENLKSVIDDGRIQSDAVLKGSNVDFKNTKIENNDVIGNGESESFAVFSSDGLLAR